MRDIDRAVADLAFIQERMAASTRFRGFAPYAVAGTGGLALTTAAAQSVAPNALWNGGAGFVMTWVAIAALSLGLIAVEALARSRRLHGNLADTMIAGTLRTALPFFAVGAIITFVILRGAPDVIWILPGLWQLLVALLGFATLATLPRSVAWASSWYVLTGATVLALAASIRMLTPWMMGVPFGVGQLLLALLLRRAVTDRISHD